ncbi:ATP synthase F1 subunit gamma [bacterium]|nr:ATP synthase F1 subunit gamma [bacterium]MBU2461516.1 ATP synthase F1 subunit gamma [bacterium]
MAGQSVRDIKTRVGSIKNIQDITKTMMLVAAAKLSKAESRITRLRPYAKRLNEMMGDIKLRAEISHPLLSERKVKKEFVLVITSERGLCGGFNSKIIRKAEGYFGKENIERKLVLIGKKGSIYFGKMDREIVKEYQIPDKVSFEFARTIGNEMVTGYIEERFDRFVAVYNEFKSVFRQEQVAEKLLPIIPKPLAAKFVHDYIYEPSAEDILDSLLPAHFNYQIYRILLESQAAEHAARMTAMEQATTNAKERIKELILTFNRARQASITSEIAEIVTTTMAL